VYIGEVVVPLLLIVGPWTHLAALVMVLNMVAAVALAQAVDLGRLSSTGSWEVELQAMHLFGAAAIALLGAGRISVGGLAGRMS